MPDEPVETTEEQIPDEKQKIEYKYIRWDDSGTMAHLTLARPKQNFMNMEMM